MSGGALRNLRLSPAPRSIPLTLRLRLLGNLGVMIGAASVAVGLILAVYVTPLTRLRDARALGRSSLPAQGVVERVEYTNTRINEQPVHRFEYRFTLPDGRSFTGGSYSRTATTMVPRPVTIDYLPGDPRVSRVRGMSMTIAPMWLPLVFIVPGMMLMGVALLWARGQMRTLRHGELAAARIKTFQNVTTEGTTPTLSLEEYHKQPAVELTSMGHAFIAVWTVFAALITIGGATVIVIGTLWIGRDLDRPWLIVLGMAAALIWFTVGGMMVLGGMRMRRQLEGDVPRVRPVRCTFAFEDSSGGTIEAHNDFTYDESRPLNAEQEPVVYDPGKPENAVLLRALPVEVAILSSGEFEAIASPVRAMIRVMIVLLLIIVPLAWYLQT